MNGKFYIILYRSKVDPAHKDWDYLDYKEYTEKEANRELRHWKKECGENLEFRKRCIYNGPIQVLSVKNHK